jgi:hypothetical protein
MEKVLLEKLIFPPLVQKFHRTSWNLAGNSCRMLVRILKQKNTTYALPSYSLKIYFNSPLILSPIYIGLSSVTVLYELDQFGAGHINGNL